nr:MAG TPA: hypothetical protein [Caudoviricetes sp.]
MIKHLSFQTNIWNMEHEVRVGLTNVAFAELSLTV